MKEILNILNICKCLLKISGLTTQSSTLHRITFSMFLLTLFSGSVNLLLTDSLAKKQLTESMVGIPGVGCITAVYWNFIYQCAEVEHVINDLNNIVNEQSQRKDGIEFYSKIDAKINKRMKQTFIGGFLCASLLFWSSIAFVFYKLIIRDHSLDDWSFIIPVRLPFELDTDLKHIIYNLHEVLNCYIAYLVISAIVIFFVNVSWFITALYDDLNLSIAALSESSENWQTLNLQLKKAIVFHNRIRIFISRFSRLMSAVIFMIFTCSLQCMCGFLLLINTLEELSMHSLLTVAVCVAFLIVFEFSFCYFGTIITASGEQVGYSIYQTKWYGFPVHLQRYCILIIAQSQQAQYLNGFQIIPCTLNNFAKLLNWTISVYMVFSNLGE